MANENKANFTPIKLVNGITYLFTYAAWLHFLGKCHDDGVIPNQTVLNKELKVPVVDVEQEDLRQRFVVKKRNPETNRKESVSTEIGRKWLIDQYKTYLGRNKVKASDKEKHIVRILDGIAIHWPNRKHYGQYCDCLRCAISLKLVAIGLTSTFAIEKYNAERLSNANGDLLIDDMSNWKIEHYHAEYRRLAGIQTGLSELTDFAALEAEQERIEEEEREECHQLANEMLDEETTETADV